MRVDHAGPAQQSPRLHGRARGSHLAPPPQRRGPANHQLRHLAPARPQPAARAPTLPATAPRPRSPPRQDAMLVGQHERAAAPAPPQPQHAQQASASPAFEPLTNM